MSGLRKAPRTLFTRAAFIEWLRVNRIRVYVWPYEIVPCSCGDHNCHGWRLVFSPRSALGPVERREEMVGV